MVVHFLAARRCAASLRSLTGAPSIEFVHVMLARGPTTTPICDTPPPSRRLCSRGDNREGPE